MYMNSGWCFGIMNNREFIRMCIIHYIDILCIILSRTVRIAHLARARGYQSGGRGFDPRLERLRSLLQKQINCSLK